jgi:hypothetical protein
VNISDIVDEESESIRLLFLLGERGELSLHRCVDEGVLVVSSGAGKPVDDVRDGFFYVILLEYKPWVVADRTTLVEVGSVNEVPA